MVSCWWDRLVDVCAGIWEWMMVGIRGWIVRQLTLWDWATIVMVTVSIIVMLALPKLGG